jgi:hypothetical protein
MLSQPSQKSHQTATNKVIFTIASNPFYSWISSYQTVQHSPTSSLSLLFIYYIRCSPLLHLFHQTWSIFANSCCFRPFLLNLWPITFQSHQFRISNSVCTRERCDLGKGSFKTSLWHMALLLRMPGSTVWRGHSCFEALSNEFAVEGRFFCLHPQNLISRERLWCGWILDRLENGSTAG